MIRGKKKERERGKNSILKYLEKSLENWIKLGLEYLVHDKSPKNVEEHGLLLPFELED